MSAKERHVSKLFFDLLAEFGEKVHYKKRVPEGEKKNKGKVQWDDAIWLGMADRSNEYYAGTKEGVIKTYAVRRRPDDAKWDKEAVMGMMGTIEHPTPTARGCEVPIRVPRGDQPSETPINIPVRGAEVIAARRLYLLPRDFEKYR